MGSFLQNDPEMQRMIGIELVNTLAMAPDTAFDGASRLDKEVALWNAMEGSADQEILSEKGVIDARTRDMFRNDAFVQSGANMHKDHIVGATYILNAKPNHKYLGLDEQWQKEFQEEVEAKFNLAANSINCWFDASRKNTFTEMVRLAVGVHLAGGEVLASSEWLKDDRTRPFKTAVQMIDIDRLSTPMGKLESRFLRGGVQKDRFGAPIGYHIRRTHPSEWLNNYAEQYVWDYVETYSKPWGRKKIEHIFEMQRADQTRAVGILASSLSELKISKQFRKTAIQRQILDATIAASIESELPTEVLYNALGGSNATNAEVQKAISAYSAGFLGSVKDYSGSRGMKIDGVRIPHFHPGTKLNVRPVGHGGPLGTDFEKSLLRYLAAGMGVSYEQLSKDFSESNYSNFKAASNETRRRMMSLKKIVADRFATWVFSLWLEEAISVGEITSMYSKAPSFWDRMNREAYTSCEWIGAGKGQVDELKETQAAALRLKYNLSTLQDELARNGQDIRVVLPQREREVIELTERGLASDPEDNSLNAASGSPQERNPRDTQSSKNDGDKTK